MGFRVKGLGVVVTCGFPISRGTILGVPITRAIVYWGPYWGPPLLGNYHLLPSQSYANASLVGGKEACIQRLRLVEGNGVSFAGSLSFSTL